MSHSCPIHFVLLLSILAGTDSVSAFDLGKQLKQAVDAAANQAATASQQAMPAAAVAPGSQASAPSDAQVPLDTKPFDLKGITLGMSAEAMKKLLGKPLTLAEIGDKCLLANGFSALRCDGPTCGSFAGTEVTGIMVGLKDNAVFEALFVLPTDRADADAINAALTGKYGKPQRYRKSYYAELSFPRNFVFQWMGYNAPVNWKEKRS